MGGFLDEESPCTWDLGRSDKMVWIDCLKDPDSIHLMNNIRFFLFMEQLGMGPERYCIRYRPICDNFVDYLTQVLTHLPRNKMFFWPRSPRFDISLYPREMSIPLRVLLRQPTMGDIEYWMEFEY